MTDDDLEWKPVAEAILDPRTRVACASAGIIRDPAWRIGPRRSEGLILHAVVAGGHAGEAGGHPVRTGPGDVL